MAEGINVNERGELASSQPPDSASQATANANAAAGAFLDFQAKIDLVVLEVSQPILDLRTDYRFLRLRVDSLERMQSPNTNADDPDFQDCAHVPEGTPC